MIFFENHLVIHLIFLCIAIKGIRTEEPEKIVGGKDSIHYPFMAGLERDRSMICGAAIIDDRHLLTAAHCTGVTPERYTIITGTKYKKSGGEVYQVEKFTRHEKYHGGMEGVNYDIAVIKLKGRIRFNQFQQPINLPTSPTTPNSIAKVMGWGLITWPTQWSPHMLQEMDAMVLSHKVCSVFDISYYVDSAIAMCAYAKIGTGTCPGDSGGPLVFNNTLIGVVSRGYPCATGQPDVYTKVYSFLDFIQENTVAR